MATRFCCAPQTNRSLNENQRKFGKSSAYCILNKQCVSLSPAVIKMSSMLYHGNWNHNFSQIAKESGFRLKRPTSGLLDWRLIGKYRHYNYSSLLNRTDNRLPIVRLFNSSIQPSSAGSIDVDCLVKENDLDRLDSVNGHLSTAPLSTLLLQNSVLDMSVVKYFELAQLSIQFLLFCKQFLDHSVTTLRNRCFELQIKNEKLSRSNKRRNEEGGTTPGGVIEEMNQVVGVLKSNASTLTTGDGARSRTGQGSNQ